MELHHDIVIGTGDSQKNLENLVTSINKIETSLEPLDVQARETSKAFEAAFKESADKGYDFASAVQFVEKRVEILKSVYERTAKKIESMPLGSAERKQAQENLAVTKTQIQGLVDELGGLKKRLEEVPQPVTTVRTQMRNLTNQINAMRLEGREGTAEFKKMEEELSRLALAQRQTTKSMQADSTGATQWHGMIEGLQGLTGAYTAASGVIGVFTQDQEKLMQIQTKVQSLMSILMGMQQVSNTLHETSTFRLRTLTAVQTGYNAVIAATSKFLQAFRISAKAADATAKVLTATLTMGLGVAIPLLITALDKWKTKQEESNKLNRQAAETSADNITSIGILSKSYKELGDNLSAKKRFIKEHREEMEKLGVAVTGVSDADKLLIDNTQDYIKAQMLRAQADAARAVSTEKSRKILEKKLSFQDKFGVDYSDFDYEKNGTTTRFVSYGTAGQGSTMEVETKAGAAYRKIQALEKETERYFSLSMDFGQKADDLFKKNFKTPQENNKAQNDVKASEDAYARFLESVNKKRSEVYEAGIKDEVEKINYRREQVLAAIKKEYEEVKKAMEGAGKDTVKLDEAYSLYTGAVNAGADADIAKYNARQQAEREKELQKYEGYFKQRERIERDYKERQEIYFNDDGSLKSEYSDYNGDEIRANMEQERKDALSALDNYYASKEASFEAWCSSITDETIDSLIELLDRAKEELAELEASGIGDSSTVATSRAKVDKLQNTLQKKQAEAGVNNRDKSPNKRTIEQWKDLQDALRDCAKDFEELGDSIGGVVGEIMKSASSIATSAVSMISGIVQLTQASVANVEGMSKGAATAIKAVERASVILAIVQAAIAIINEITSIINGNAEAERKAAQAAEEYRLELEKLATTTALDRFETIFGTDKLAQMKIFGDRIGDLKKSIDELYNETTVKFIDSGQSDIGIGSLNYAIIQKRIESITSDGRTGWQKFWGSGQKAIKKLSPEDYLTDGEFDGDKLATWYDKYGENITESNKHYIETLLDQWDEYQDSLNAVGEYLSSLFGSVAEDIADSMITAFEESGDAAADLGDISADIAKKIAKDYAKSILLEKVFTKELEDKIKNQITSQDTKGAIKSISEAINAAGELAPKITEFLKGVDEITGIAERSSAEKGIAQASQDSVDELNGRATAIQGHTFSIAENTKTLVYQCADILETLYYIEHNTARLESIEVDMATMARAIGEMNDRGIKMR